MQDIIDTFNQGDKEKAVQMAVRAIDAHQDEVAPYALLVTMLINMRAYDQAEALVMKALGLFHDDPELRYNWGLLAYQQGEYRDALMRLQPLTGVSTRIDLRGDANYMVALSYKALGDTLRALPYALTAHECRPDAKDAALLCANLLLGMGVADQAKAILTPLVASDDAQVLLTYGMALSALDDDRAATYLDQAQAADPEAYTRARELVHFLGGQAGETNG